MVLCLFAGFYSYHNYVQVLLSSLLITFFLNIGTYEPFDVALLALLRFQTLDYVGVCLAVKAYAKRSGVEFVVA